MPTPDELVAEKRQEQQAEWGTYVASGPIDIDGVRAFNKGNAVPVSHVDRGVVDKSQVEKVKQEPAKAVKAAHDEKKD